MITSKQSHAAGRRRQSEAGQSQGGRNCVQIAPTAQKWQEDDRLWNR